MNKGSKVYLITGATSGIGLDLAKKILMKKNYVICCGRSFKELDNFVKKKNLINFIKKLKLIFQK
jgi:short-subunit dehydrogenase involved in D-alanine esterification of teichoic acids